MIALSTSAGLSSLGNCESDITAFKTRDPHQRFSAQRDRAAVKQI